MIRRTPCALCLLAVLLVSGCRTTSDYWGGARLNTTSSPYYNCVPACWSYCCTPCCNQVSYYYDRRCQN